MADKLFRVQLLASPDRLPEAGSNVLAGLGLDARLHVLADGAEGSLAGARPSVGAEGSLAGARPSVGLELTVVADWARPLAELRWQVDSLVRRVRRLYDLRGARLELAASDVPYAVRSALALDLRRGFSNGQPSVPAALALDEETSRYAESEDLFRRWVNEDPSLRTSLAIAEDVRRLAELGVNGRDGRIEVDVLDEQRLAELGLNLLLAVGRAAEVSPPRLAVARWTPSEATGRGQPSGPSVGGAPPESRPPLMLLGKGITFDTGGINVKPYESFVSHMRNDMAGAALVYAAFRHLVLSGFPRPLVLVIPTCENAVGERAMRPGSVVKSHRGQRVKIDHTDAEGRLVLADALSYAEDRFAPELTLCFATLTTAALQAYGPYATPVHFAPPEVEAALRAASELTGEDLHFFPRRAWHFEANRDDEADLKNTARLPGYMPHAAGSRNAAHFLLHFARAPLVHADIFASTWNWGGDYPGTGFGATGAPLRTFLTALQALGARP